MKTFLIATDSKFWHEDRGNRARTASLCRSLLAHEYQVWIFLVGKLNFKDWILLRARFPGIHWAVQKNSQFEDGLASPSGLLRSLENQARTLPNRLRRVARKWLRRSSVPAAPRNEPVLEDFTRLEIQSEFRECVKALSPDAVLASYLKLAYLVRGLKPCLPDGAVTLIDTLDVLHRRYDQFQEAGQTHWISISREEEAEALRLFDVIVAIQDVDAEVFREMVPEVPVLTLLHASPIVWRPARRTATVHLTYIGTEGPHNTEAIAAFLSDTWPELIHACGSSVELWIAGKVGQKLDQAAMPEGVRLLGFVNDLNQLYQETDIVINPVYFGGGLKIKNVEALCNSKPLVTTSVGAMGLEDGVGKAFWVADDAPEMLSQLVKLSKNYQARQVLAKSAHRFALEHFSPERVYTPLIDFLETRE